VGKWVKKKPVEIWQRELDYGPSWRAVGIGAAILLPVVCWLGTLIMEARLELSRLWP
jgi:hypothetical protein